MTGEDKEKENEKLYLLNVGQTSIKVCLKTLTEKDQPKRYTLTCFGSRTPRRKEFEHTNNGHEDFTTSILTIPGLKPSLAYTLILRGSSTTKHVYKRLHVNIYGTYKLFFLIVSFLEHLFFR